MARIVDGAAHCRNITGHAGGSFVMHHAYSADGMAVIRTQALRNQVGLHTTSPAFNTWQANDLSLQA